MHIFEAPSLETLTTFRNNDHQLAIMQRQVFRRREKIMSRFRSMGSLQKFTAIQLQFQNHFNHERHNEKRATFKNLRQSSLNAWNEILVAQRLT